LTAKASTPRPRIAVVEDDEDLAFTLTYNLKKDGRYEVERFAGGLVALDALLARPPDLVLLDLNLPDVDGLTICRELRKGEETRRIPRMQFAVVIETRFGFLEAHLVVYTQLFAQIAQMMVTGKDGVIEAVHFGAVFKGNRTSQPTQHRRGFVNSNFRTLLRQEVSEADAHDTAADNTNFLFCFFCHYVFTHLFTDNVVSVNRFVIFSPAVPSPKIGGCSTGGEKVFQACNIKSTSTPTSLFQPT